MAFITFEGIEGSGKSTQCRLLAEKLKTNGHEVLLTREPGGTITADNIRSLLLNPDIQLLPESELLLFLAARFDHVERVIKPTLQSGKTVICDRFTDSTIAYQAYGRSLDINLIHDISGRLFDKCKPDITVLLDMDAEQALARIKRRDAKQDRIEQMPLQFHTRVREGFLTLAGLEPERFITINACNNEQRTAQEIIEKIQPLL